MQAKGHKRWQEPNPGSAFKVTANGPLLLRFESHWIEALRPTTGQAWVRTSGSNRGFLGCDQPTTQLSEAVRDIGRVDILTSGVPLRPTRGMPRPSMRPRDRRLRQNMRQFFSYVNGGVIRELSLEWPYGDWQLFRLLTSSPYALERAALGDRTLTSALANYRLLAPKPPRGARAFWRRWSARSARELVGRLGFPAKRSTLKVLRKLDPADALPSTLEGLRDALNDADARVRLFHAERITPELVVLLHPAILGRCSPALIADAETLSGPSDTFRSDRAYRLRRTLADLLLLEDELQLRKRPTFASRNDILAHHDALVERSRLRARFGTAPFPLHGLNLPTLEGLKLEWLRTSQELYAEGRQMRHCLGSMFSHHRLAARGRFVAYKVETQDLRATLAFVHDPDGWRVYDFASFANGPVPSIFRSWADSVAKRQGSHTPTSTVEQYSTQLLAGVW